MVKTKVRLHLSVTHTGSLGLLHPMLCQMNAERSPAGGTGPLGQCVPEGPE